MCSHNSWWVGCVFHRTTKKGLWRFTRSFCWILHGRGIFPNSFYVLLLFTFPVSESTKKRQTRWRKPKENRKTHVVYFSGFVAALETRAILIQIRENYMNIAIRIFYLVNTSIISTSPICPTDVTIPFFFTIYIMQNLCRFHCVFMEMFAIFFRFVSASSQRIDQM